MSLPSITWLPSPYRNARDPRYPIRGVVSHRIVGTLLSARADFGVAPGTSRNASTHFGIGLIGGKVAIDQFVDLSDMAWGNGDVRDPSWSLIQAGVNPNLTTVSIEHEDGGSANRGRVSEAVWSASMELQKLITSGDVARIRAAGIRVRSDSTVSQLAAIPKDARGFIDHNQIAGPNKPYCFRRWLDDPGFVEGSPSRRDRLLAALNAQEDDDMPNLTIYALETIRIDAGAAIRGAPTTQGDPLFTSGRESSAVRVGTILNAESEWSVYWLADRKRWGYTAKQNVLKVEPYQSVVSVGVPQADFDAAQAQIAALSGRISTKDVYISQYPKG